VSGGPQVALAAADLAPSVLREALQDGAGGNLALRAVITLFEWAGLLGRRDVVAAIVQLDLQDQESIQAGLDVPAAEAAACGELPLRLTRTERQVLGLGVQLIDLGAAVALLDGEPLTWTVAAVLASVGHGGPGCSAGRVLTAPHLCPRPPHDEPLPALDAVVGAAARAEAELARLRAEQVGAPVDGAAARDQILTRLITAVRGARADLIRVPAAAGTPAQAGTR
jgi:hypothetical protein